MDGVGVKEPDIVPDVEDARVHPFKKKLDDSFVRRRGDEPCSIFRVPPVIRNQNPGAYEPRVVSIGPYHRGREDLMEMEMRKLRMARRLFSRHPDAMVAECFDKVRALQYRALHCYADRIEMGSWEFTETMVLDGCFIIGVLLSQIGENWVWEEEENEEKENFNMHTLALIYEDLIKLENQIPLFILVTLYDLLVPQQIQDKISIPPLFVILYKSFLEKQHVKMVIPALRSPDQEMHHLLDLFHKVLLLGDFHKKFKSPFLLFLENVLVRAMEKIHLPFFLNRDRKSSDTFSGWMPNATELQKAGVKFMPKENCSFLDVSFNNGMMKIPTFYISEHTLPILRNLIAFEQCYPSTGRYFTFYADLMDSLVDTPKDVKVLQQAGILKIGLSNQEEVAQLFNQLCKDVYYYKGTSYLNKVYSDVNYYCNSKWNRWKAFLKRNYFRNPWTITSVVAAIILLLLTFLQTFYAIFGYYHP